MQGYNVEQLNERWSPVLNNESLTPIQDNWKRNTTAILLENEQRYLKEAGPSNQTAGIDNWDPVLISLIRQAMPNLIAYELTGVQPMQGPNGLVFAMKARKGDQQGDQSLFDEVDTGFSASYEGNQQEQQGDNPAVLNDDEAGDYDYVEGMSTEDMEKLGYDGDNAWNEMGFTIEQVSVVAKGRALKAEYSIEMAQDLKAIHGLDAETELANILSAEILAEINRHVLRSIYVTAKPGAQTDTTTAGTYDLDADSDGRWMVEKFKGLLYQIERDANAVGQQTRRGKANRLVVSADVASALTMAGVLDYAPALQAQSQLSVDDTGNTYAGTLLGRYQVYVDPYSANVSNNHFYVAGYKGSNPYDAGLFYCPYIPLQMHRAVSPDDFIPRIGFKTRYGMIANPDVNEGGALTANNNPYFRRTRVKNLQ